MLLGATNLSPIEVARMYNTLANGGFRSPLRSVRAVIAESGKQLKAPQLEVAEAAPADAVYTVDRMLVEVMERGTGRPARKSLPPGLVVAGKTGTSNDYRDSWFSGFSGSHLIVVWMGHDDNSQTGLTGTTGALAAWSKLMSSIPTTSFDPLMPESLENRWIDYYSGLETSPYCNGSAVSMPFKIGTPLYASDAVPARRGAARDRSGAPHPRTCPSRPRIRRATPDLPSPWAGQSAAMRSFLPIVLALAVVTGGCAIEPFQKDDGKHRVGQAQPARARPGADRY